MTDVINNAALSQMQSDILILANMYAAISTQYSTVEKFNALYMVRFFIHHTIPGGHLSGVKLILQPKIKKRTEKDYKSTTAPDGLTRNHRTLFVVEY